MPTTKKKTRAKVIEGNGTRAHICWEPGCREEASTQKEYKVKHWVCRKHA